MKPILSARIDDQNAVHTTLTIFNRGANCGTLVVNTDDANEILKLFQKCPACEEGYVIGPDHHDDCDLYAPFYRQR